MGQAMAQIFGNSVGREVVGFVELYGMVRTQEGARGGTFQEARPHNGLHCLSVRAWLP